MTLSIITVNYNHRDGLRKTIQSVINQTFTDYEYIIIDGGSDDGSVDVIKEYSDKITYWVSERDRGIYNGMNKGEGDSLRPGFRSSARWKICRPSPAVFPAVFCEMLFYTSSTRLMRTFVQSSSSIRPVHAGSLGSVQVTVMLSSVSPSTYLAKNAGISCG